MIILRVALDVPLPKLFDYRSEDATRADIGYRVLVPFGKKRLVGLIWDVATKSKVIDSRLRPVEKILREAAPLPREWLALVEFCSGYYHGPLGEVVAAALPPRLRTAKTVPIPPRDYVLTPAGTDVLAATPPRHRRLRALLLRLAQGRASESELATQARGSRNPLRRGIEAGWIAAIEPDRSEPRFVHAHELTTEQRQAIGTLRSGLDKFQVSLLFGVTGSGKTEIYLHLIAEVLAQGRQVLILVPEIALTPALEAAFRDRFPGACIVTQTSAMAELERARGWLLAHGGRADIVLGTRLSVFTPLPRLGLVVVDEEQDASFKQREGVRYSARDLAITRAQIAGTPVVLCSATPSLESFHHATRHRPGGIACDTPDRHAGASAPGGHCPSAPRSARGAPCAWRAIARFPQSPRLCACARLPRLRLGQGLQALFGEHGRAFGRAAAALPPLRTDRRHSARLSGMRQPRFADIRTRDTAYRDYARRKVSARAHPARGQRRGAREERAQRSTGARHARRHPRGHADPRQGPPFRAPDACRRAQRRQRSILERLSRGRADLCPVAAGRRTRRTRESAGRGADPDALSRASSVSVSRAS